ncbi:MAG: CHAT domain-containing tetratricopeptide repeat protein [Rhodomicrobium sp.]
MTGLRRIFLCFAFLLLVPGAYSSEPSERLKAIDKEAAAFYQAGSYREALEASKQALALTIEEFGSKSEQASIQAYGAAYAAELAGDFGEAERDYAQSLQIREIVYGPESAGVATTLERLGHVVLKAARPAAAEALFMRELKIWRGLVGEHAITAGAYAGLGEVNLSRRDYSSALAYYRQAVNRLTSQEARQELARSVIEADVKRHREIFIGLAQAAWGLREQGGADRAALMEETFRAGQSAWATSAASALAKMTARLKANDTELGRAIRGLETLSDRIRTLHEEDMEALAKWSKVQQADASYRETLAAFRAASIAQSKDNAPAVKRQNELVARLQELVRRCPGGAHSAGCDTSEKERVAIAQELGSLSAQVSQGVGGIRELSQRLQSAEHRLAGYLQFKTGRESRLAESQRLEDALAASRAAIVKRFPDYLSLAEPAPLTVAQTQALLREDEALVAILPGPQGSLIWAVTRESAEWAEIETGEAELASQVAALRRGLDPLAGENNPGPAVPANFDIARAYRLYRLLLGRFEPMLSGKQHLLLVPAGPLSSLPFQVLVTDPPLGGLSEDRALKQTQWLIRRHALSVLPSVQSLSALRKLSPNGAAKPFFGMGDPVFGDSPEPQENAPGRGAALPPLAAVYSNGTANLRVLQSLSSLPETAGELLTVAHTLEASEADVNLREAATKARLRAVSLKDYRVLHFATHGLVAGDLSGLNEPALVLSLPSRAAQADDALLTASEVAALDLNADWVVLSACNTASGDKVGADALSGLARAFMFAGARSLLVSHWAVESQAAVELTTRTFAFLRAEPGLGRAEAFRRAMLSLIDEGHTPSYWAPFVIAGEGSAGLRPRG